MGKTFLLGVDDDIDAPLPVEQHILVPVARGKPESHHPEQRRQFLGLGFIGGKFDELDALHRNAVRYGGNGDCNVRLGARDLVHQVDQRTPAVDRDGFRRTATELIVEYLQRQRAVVACGGDRTHEIGHRQIAFAGHVPEMAAPVEQVHVDTGRVGELDDEDAVAGDGADGLDVDAPRQRMEGIEDQADVRVVCAANDLPGIAMIVDVASPGECFVAYAQAAPRRPFAKVVEVCGGAIDASQRHRRDIGTDEHQICAEFLHQIELALRPVEGACPLWLRQPFEIAERLEQRNLQPVIAHHAADLGGRAVEGQKIVLEYLDAVETGSGDGGELLPKVAADRYRGDGGFHTDSSLPDQVANRPHRNRVATWAEAGDHRRRHLRHKRAMIDLLTPVDVGDVQFNDRSRKHLQRIEDGNRGKGKAGRVDDDAGALVDRLVNPVDDLALEIRLMEAQDARRRQPRGTSSRSPPSVVVP